MSNGEMRYIPLPTCVIKFVTHYTTVCMLLLVDFPEDGGRKARCTEELEYSRVRYGAPVSISSSSDEALTV